MNYDEIFDIFKSSYVGKEIKKDIIIDKLFNVDDKEIIKRFVTNAYIMYSVKADNINKKAEENFTEIQIIEININDYRAIYDIYGILLSIIPYSILAIFRYNDRVSFAVSNRILAEYKNNKGKIYTSYLIKEEDISRYLKIDIDNCQTMIEVYNKWISNIEDAVAYYERLDRVMELIEIGLHIKSEEVLEKIESYIARDCGTYNMRPKAGWKSKLEKYSDSSSFVKKVETHILWEYLSENTFFKNKLEDFLSWNDFKEDCAYNNSLNDIYYSQHNSRMSYDESISDADKYIEEHDEFTRNNVKTIVGEQKSEHNINNLSMNTNKNEFENTYEELLNDKEFMLQAIEMNSLYIAYASNELRNDEDFILQAMEKDTLCFKYASDELKNNKEFMLQSIEENCLCIIFASDQLKNDKEFMLQAIEKNGFCISWSSEKFRNDKELMAQVVEECSLCYEYISKKLKNDTEFSMQTLFKDYAYSLNIGEELNNNKELLLNIIEIGIFCCQYINEELLNDKEFMLQAIERNSICIEYASEELKNDKDFMLQAVEMNSLFIVHASDELKNSKEFMLKAIEKHNECMAYASEELRSDEDFILQLISINSFNILFTSNKIRNDKEFMLQTIKKDSLCIIEASDELKNDKEFMLQAIETDGLCVIGASDELKNDKEFMLQAIEKNGICFKYASNQLKNDKNWMLLALQKLEKISEHSLDEIFNNERIMDSIVTKAGETLRYVSEELKDNKELLLKAIKQDNWCFQYVSEELKNNKEFMLQLIENNCSWCLKYASDRLRNDKEIVEEAIKYSYETLIYASEELRNDKDFMLQILKNDPMSVIYASEELRNDEDFMLQILKNDPVSVIYASDRLKNNKEFMLKLIRKNSLCFAFASEKLRSDKEFILEAIKYASAILLFVDETLKNDKEFMLQLVGEKGECLLYVSEELKNNKDVVLTAVKKALDEECLVLQYASDELRNNKEFMLKVAKEDFEQLECISDELKDDKDFILQAIDINSNILNYASDELKNDKEVVISAVKKAKEVESTALYFASDELKNDKEFILQVIKEWLFELDFASEELKNDKDFMLKAIEIDGFCIYFASEKLKNDKEFMLQAIGKNDICFQYASDELKNNKDFILQAVKINYNILDYVEDEKLENINNEIVKKNMNQTYYKNLNLKVNSNSFELWEEIMKEVFEIYDYLKELGYEDREEQQNMTMDIIQAIEDNQNIIIEAGVGIGKSYAYLIPLMLYYTKTNKSFIISTSTIALQEQLQKDISILNSILDWNVPSIIAKGRTHYICKKKVTDLDLLQELDKTPSKIDRTNYDKFNDYEWNKISVNKCKFKECEYYNSCYFLELREKIRTFEGAIICNHDLLLENQKRKNEFRRLLLPNVKFIVLDEAHNLEEKGRNSFKEDVTLQECREIINKAQIVLSKFNYYNFENIEIAQNSISRIFDILEKQVGQQVQEAIQNNRIIAQNDLEICKVFNTQELIKQSSSFYSAIQNINIYMQSIDYGSSEDIDSLISDLEKLEDIFGNLKEIESNNIFWIDNKRKIVLNTCSKYVNKQIKEVLFNDKDSIKILTSATLNTSNKGETLYKYFTKNVGLDIDEKLFLSEPKMSPFDYENNMICYCCKDITAPNGNHDNYIRDITRKILELLNITKGKTLILFTSKADMKLVYENLRMENLPYDILIQKDGSSQNSTKEKFKNNINSVLLSTGSFWEGIDIQGQSLSNVIIVRLPFPIPDPIIEYKCSVVNDNEKVLIPEMKIKLKQGIGRLIRAKDDIGIVSILDSRIEKHINKVLECIPTSNITYNIEDVKSFSIKHNITE